MIFWIVFERDPVRLVSSNFGTEILAIFFDASVARWRIQPQSTARVGIFERTHNRVPCLASWVTTCDNRTFDNFAMFVMEFPERCILTETEPFCLIIDIAADRLAIRRVVSVGYVTMREWGSHQNAVFNETATAIPYGTL